MLPTSIRHGDLVIDYQADGCVQIVRQSNATGIVLSVSEWTFIQKVLDLQGWPVAPPTNATVELRS